MTSTKRTRGAARTALIALSVATAINGTMIPAAEAASICGSLESVVLGDGVELCTHGADRHLLDIAPLNAAAELIAAATTTVSSSGVLGGLGLLDQTAPDVTTPKPDSAATEAGTFEGDPVPFLLPVCDGNGIDGERVQAIAVDVAGSDIAPATDGDIRRWVGQADWTYAASAQRDGAERRLRVETEVVGDSCRATITRIQLPADEAQGHAEMWKSLANMGFNSSNRKYMLFVNVDQGTCGTGSVFADDSADADNASNSFVGFAQVNAPCWAAADNGYFSVLAHELTHNLGGVQDSAPNSNNGFHCIDDWDLMCYDDGTATGIVCEDNDDATTGQQDKHERLLDCGANDYFNASTNVTGYLATHWNIADSSFLSGHPEPTQPGPAQPLEEEADQEDAAPESDPSEDPEGEAGVQPSAAATVIEWVLNLMKVLTGLTD